MSRINWSCVNKVIKKSFNEFNFEIKIEEKGQIIWT